MVEKNETTFAQWRNRLGLSIADCVELLGLSPSQVAVLLRGIDGAGRLALPRRPIRILMSAAEAGLRVAPIALSAAELSAERDLRRKRLEGRRARYAEAA